MTAEIVDIDIKEKEKQKIISLELLYHLESAFNRAGLLTDHSATDDDRKEIITTIWVVREAIKGLLGIEEFKS